MKKKLYGALLLGNLLLRGYGILLWIDDDVTV